MNELKIVGSDDDGDVFAQVSVLPTAEANPTTSEFIHNHNASVVCSRLERFFLSEENSFDRKIHHAPRGIVIHGRRIGS
jgi:hypothetical protein